MGQSDEIGLGEDEGRDVVRGEAFTTGSNVQHWTLNIQRSTERVNKAGRMYGVRWRDTALDGRRRGDCAECGVA